MPTQRIDFGKPATVDTVELGQTDMESLVNGYQDEFKCYVKRPGVTLFTTLPKAATVDGIYESIGHYVHSVCSGNIYTLDQYGGQTPWTGTTMTPGNPVIFTEDLSDVFATHGGKITKMVEATKVASELGGNAPTTGVTHIIFKDSYLLCNGTSSLVGDQFFSDDKVNNYSASNSWEVFNNEEVADSLICITTKWNETLSWGPESIEWIEDDGITPWAKMSVPPPGVGLLAPYSVVDLGATFYFLSVFDRAVRIIRLEGRQVKPVSYPIDPLISTATGSNAHAWCLTINRIPFYVINFPTDGIILAYNALQNTWSTFDGLPINSTHYVKAWDKTLIGDSRTTGKVFTLDGLTDDGNAITFELTSGNISWGTDRRKRCTKYVFRVKRGQATDYSEPHFKVQFKDDGGSWSPVRKVSLGFAGDSESYGVLYSCGIYRQRQIRIIHDDIKSDFILAAVEETYEVLAN